MHSRDFKLLILLSVCLLTALPYSLSARVDSVVVESRERVLKGATFGKENYGPYELIKGTVYFSLDPSNPSNQNITDLLLAPRNPDGRVLFSSNIVILKPVDDGKSAETTLVEVSNRGGMFTPSYFNRGTSYKMGPKNKEWFGDKLVMRYGFTVIWVGWQFDVPRNEDNLFLNAPVSRYPDGRSITGLVRSDWVVDDSVNTLKLGHRNLIGYPVSDTSDHRIQLTRRDSREGKREVIPRSKWKFAKSYKDTSSFSRDYIYSDEGFKAGYIYELVYPASNPPVVGVGMAAIRDIISYAKYNPASLFPAKYGIAAGVSQTGRFLRHFIYDGFNTDEHYRKAYDGLMIMTAGAGRGSFNHRFAQPSRDAHRYSAFFYPTDIFPFTGRPQWDPKQWKSDGLMAHYADSTLLPKTFYINTGYEYWGRAAGLIHTSTDGNEDIEPLPNERIYHIASGQHFVDQFPPDPNRHIPDSKGYQGNPLAFKINYRALLIGLKQWVADSTDPPRSQFPRIANRTLVKPQNIDLPQIPGISLPKAAHTAYPADYGPRWQEGIITRQPPKLGNSYTSLVPQVDDSGNEMGGIRNIEIRVPLATYLPWSTRFDKKANQHELADFRGTFIPLPLNSGNKNDSRPSVQKLYQSKDDYMNEVSRAVRVLEHQGFLLPEDTELVIRRAEERWRWIHQRR